MGVKNILQQGGDGTAIPSNMVGEVVVPSGANITCTNAGQWYASPELTVLQPGSYIIIQYVKLPAPTSTANCILSFIATNGNNDNTGALIGQVGGYTPSATGVSQRADIVNTRAINIASATSLYVKAYSEDIAGAVVGVNIQTIRIA
jgi:S1-C subfamily serine protease